jgi:hypothetical protein
VAEILAKYEGGGARRNELQSPLKSSLEQILQRVDRGMTAEIRFIPPPNVDGAKDGASQTKAAQFDELREITKDLEFPQIPPGQPMMRLTVDDSQ